MNFELYGRNDTAMLVSLIVVAVLIYLTGTFFDQIKLLASHWRPFAYMAFVVLVAFIGYRRKVEVDYRGIPPQFF